MELVGDIKQFDANEDQGTELELHELSAPVEDGSAAGPSGSNSLNTTYYPSETIAVEGPSSKVGRYTLNIKVLTKKGEMLRCLEQY